MAMVSDSQKARLDIVTTARQMLNGDLSFIEGAREIVALRQAAGFGECDEDFVRFIAIDSETDTLPFGDVRQLWAATALARLQPEIDRAEQWARELGATHCQSPIRRLTGNPGV